MRDRSQVVARSYLISGRVQGVGFRYFAERTARTIGVSGFVKNLSDGRVEAHAEGSLEQLSEFESRLREGPRWAQVQHVEAHEAAMLKLGSFKILPE